MCGIVGYSGKGDAYLSVYKGLCRLEYRGYDSAGIAYPEKGDFVIIKDKGRVSSVLDRDFKCGSSTVIGHTRWATHGTPSAENAHPHRVGSVCIVHNGIIENYASLREMLTEKGYTFLSQTDTEVACALISMYYDLLHDPIKALAVAARLFTGSFALCIIFKEYPERIYALRKESPLLIVPSDGFTVICSDLTVPDFDFDSYYIPESGEIAVLDNGKTEFYDFSGKNIEKMAVSGSFRGDVHVSAGYGSYMEKEIYQQPQVLYKLFSESEEKYEKIKKLFYNVNAVHMIACGTAYHAALTASGFFERVSGIPAYCHLASEFRYGEFIPDDNGMNIVISQSGETADTIAAMRYLQKNGRKVIGVVNVPSSTVDREADLTLLTEAGPEFAVASTKAFTAQVALLMRVAFFISRDSKKPGQYLSTLVKTVKDAVFNALENSEYIYNVASVMSRNSDSFYIGRRTDYALACEGSLKLKEITYIHSEALAAGELKHGTLSLINDGTPVIAIITEETVKDKTASNLEEVMARGGEVFCIAREKDMPDCVKPGNRVILPDTPFPTTVFTASAVLQLIALKSAVLLGRDVDKPRNLAKSVTVE